MSRNITVYGAIYDMPNACTIVTRPQKGEPYDNDWKNAHDADGDNIFAWLRSSIPGRTFDKVAEHFIKNSHQDEWRKEYYKQTRINEDLQADLKRSEELRLTLREELQKAREEKEQLKKKLLRKRADCLHLIKQAHVLCEEDNPVTEKIEQIVSLGCETLRWTDYTPDYEPGWVSDSGVWLCEDEVETLLNIEGSNPGYNIKLTLCASKEIRDVEIDCDLELFWNGENLYCEDGDISTGYRFDAWLEELGRNHFDDGSYYLYVKASKEYHNA